jgi:hypothetical protein
VTDSSADADQLAPFVERGVNVAAVDGHGEARPV